MMRIGLLTFSDGRPRVHEDQLETTTFHLERIEKALTKLGVDVILGTEIITTPRIALAQAKRMVAEDVCCTLLNVPIWAFPHLVVTAAQNAKPPYLLLANEDPKTASMVGMMAAAGSLDLLDVPHRRLWGDITQPDVAEKAMRFVRAASAIHALRGQQYGLIGGRSLGMYTAIADPRLWQKVFGVDIEHVDQLVRRYSAWTSSTSTSWCWWKKRLRCLWWTWTATSNG